MTPIGTYVVEKRERLGIAQYELADRIGVNPSYVNRIEKGLKSPGNLKFCSGPMYPDKGNPHRKAVLRSGSRHHRQYSVNTPPARHNRTRFLRIKFAVQGGCGRLGDAESSVS